MLTLCLTPIWLVTQAFAPELVIQRQHRDSIRTLGFDDSGARLLSGAKDGAKVWDVLAGKLLREFSAPRDAFGSAISPDGSMVAVASDDGMVRVWGVSDGGLRSTFKTPTRELVFSRDSRFLATVYGSKVEVWPTDAATPSMRIDAGCELRSVSFHPTKPEVALPCAKGTLRFWSLTTRQVSDPITLHPKWVSAVFYSENGAKFVSIGGDEKLKYWDASTRTELNATAVPLMPTALALSLDGKTFALAPDHNKGEFFVRDGNSQSNLSGCHVERITALAIDPSQRYVASGSWDNGLCLWDLEQRRLVRRLGSDAVSQVQWGFRPDALDAVAASRGMLQVWDLAHARLHGIAQLDGNPKVGRALVAGDERIVTVNEDRSVTTFDRRDGRKVAAGPSYIGSGSPTLFVDAKGKYSGLISNPLGSRGEVKFWDVATGATIKTFNLGPYYLAAGVFNPDGTLAAVSARNGLSVYNTASWQEVHSFPGLVSDKNNIMSLAFMPNGLRLVAGASDGAGIVVVNLMLSNIERRLPQPNDVTVYSVAVAADNKTIASGGNDRQVTLWNSETGTKLRELSGHEGSVMRVSFVDQGKRLLSYSADRTTKLWEVATGRLLMTYVAAGGSDFVAISPDGYYSASRAGLSTVAARVGAKVYPFEQFDAWLNRPDLLMERLGYASAEEIRVSRLAYEKRLRKMGLTASSLAQQVLAPSVKLLSKPPYSTTEAKVTVGVVATPKEAKLLRWLVYVNDVPLYGSAGLAAKSPMGEDRQFDIALLSGRNKIEIGVIDSNGSESLRETFEIFRNGKAAPGKLFVLAIGVSKYKNAAYDLTYAAKDAQDLAQALAQRSGDETAVKSLVITDKDATVANIRKAKTFVASAGVEDTVMLFFAGHGLLDDKLDYYFATTDVDFKKPSKNGLSYESFEGLLDGIAARKKLMLIDACHSGEVDKEETQLGDLAVQGGGSVKKRGLKTVSTSARSASASQVSEQLFADLRRGTGTLVIASAAGSEFSFESPTWNNGVFTYATLQALQDDRADSNADGQLSTSELHRYVAGQVQTLTNGAQHPTVRRESLEFDFSILGQPH